MTPYEQSQLNNALYREISALWQSDEVSRIKPMPQFEAKHGELMVETVLWEAVPQFLCKLDATMKDSLRKGLPLDLAPIHFASWMGGDQDGNPNMMLDVTREVCLMKQYKAAKLFAKDIERLESELSITNCFDELQLMVGNA
jgi:phosphoenolpyruvate carboxylase